MKHAFAACLVAALLLAACAPPRAQPEFQAYLVSFDQMKGATNAMLDDAAAAERRRGRDVLEARGRGPRTLGVDETFNLDAATYYASNATPPLTRAYRDALQVIVTYNDTLVALAQGKPLGELRGGASKLAGEAVALAGILGAGTLAPAIAPALPAIALLAEEAAAAASRAAFQDAFLRNFAAVEALLTKMRDGAPELFDLLARENLARLRQARLDGLPESVRVELIARHEAYRTALADWVIMIEETQAAMRDVRAALLAPGDANARVTELTDRAIRVRVLASTIRTTLGRAR